MPLASKRRRTIEDLEASAELVRPVQDRLAYHLAVDDIRPSARNPRHTLDGLNDLADSLEEYGLLQPVVVRRVDGAYELIAGHRRLAAAKQLGWQQIVAIIRDDTDDEQAYVLTLTENLQREDLSPKEEAAALEVLMRERGWTTRQVGVAIKRSHMYVSKRLRVFEDAVLAGPVLANQLAVSTAEELLRAEPDRRAGLVQRAVAEGWGQAHARRVIVESNFPSTVGGIDQHLRKVRKEIRALDPESVSAVTLAEAGKLLRALQRLINLRMA